MKNSDKKKTNHKTAETVIKGDKINFSKRNHHILKALQFQMDAGELWAIIGPNGAGKSTLLKILAREEELDQGSLDFKGKPLNQWKRKPLAFHKAKFSQEFNPDISLSVEEIVLMGRYPYFHSTPRQRDYEIVEKALQKVELEKYKNRPYNSLSGGEKQRVHLARILAQLENDIHPKTAFFDEPLNNLDVRHQHRILEEIKAFVKKGNTAVVVLHDLNLAAEFADQILLMKKGEIMARGDAKQIFQTNLMKKAYDFPCTVCTNPITQCPMIVFRKNRLQKTAFPGRKSPV